MIAAEYDALPFFRTFGVHVAAAEPGIARLEVTRSKIELRGVRASINGGIVAALAHAASRVCLDASLVPGESIGAMQEQTVNYLSSARGDQAVVEARLLRKGGRLAVVEVNVRDPAADVLNARVLVSWTLERMAALASEEG